MNIIDSYNSFQLNALQGNFEKIANDIGQGVGSTATEVGIGAVTGGVGAKVGKEVLQVLSHLNKIDNVADAGATAVKHADTPKTANTPNPNNTNTGTLLASTKCSFHGSMQVKTLNGYKPIASIQKNDWVFSKNGITGKTNYRQVLKTINSIDPDTTRITIVNGNGVKQTIISDGLHPYFVDFTGDTTPPKPSTGHSYKGNLTSAYWVGAKDIEIGHRLIDDKGNYQTVIAIHTEATPLNSYNLEVDTDHTFFIKGVDGVESVWVHNKNCWYNIPADAKKTQIGNDTVYEFEDNGRTVKVIENPEFSQKGGAQFFEVKVTGRGNKQKVTIIKENKPDITRDVNSNVVELQPGEKYKSWNPEANKPQPNQIYLSTEGHIYKTDNLARVKSVEGKLELDTEWHKLHRNEGQQKSSGRQDRLIDDHGGHLIASMFKGMGEALNLVPMNAKFNGSGGEWYEMEKEWKKTLENNGTVQVKIEPIYTGNSKRPDFFMVHQTINGKKSDPILLENKAKPTEE